MMNKLLLQHYPYTDYSTCYKNKITFDLGNFENENWKVDLEILPRHSDRIGVKGNALYITLDKSPEDFSIDSKFFMQSLKSGPSGRDELIDKLWRKYNRKEVKIFNHYINKLIQIIKNQNLKIYNLLEESGIFNRVYSRYAGCSMCPCSPGFKLKNVSSNVRNVGIYLTFSKY